MNLALRHHLQTAKREAGREILLPEQSSVAIAQRLFGNVATPSQIVARDELVQAVRAAIARLDENDREIILLQVYEGLSGKEAGHLLGIEASAVRKRLGRALLRLRKILVADGLQGTDP